MIARYYYCMKTHCLYLCLHRVEKIDLLYAQNITTLQNGNINYMLGVFEETGL